MSEKRKVIPAISEDTIHTDIMEMARVGSFKPKSKSGKISIAVWGRERSVKHLHFYRGKVPVSGVGGGCVMLDKNSFYQHGTHKDILNKDEVIALVKFLNDTHSSLGITNWKYVTVLWNDNNPNHKIPDNATMPSYDTDTM